jgi:hypothetical protein
MVQTYRQWVNTMAGYMRRAVCLLQGFYGEQDRTISRLKEALGRNNSLRHADFDRIFAAVLARRSQAQDPLARLVQDYCAGREALLAELHGLLNGDVARAQELWPRLKARLLEEQEDSVAQAVAALRRVHVEQEELSAALAGLLERSGELRANDLKTVANRLANRDPGRSADLAELLALCDSAARQTDEKWQKLAG